MKKKTKNTGLIIFAIIAIFLVIGLIVFISKSITFDSGNAIKIIIDPPKIEF